MGTGNSKKLWAWPSKRGSGLKPLGPALTINFYNRRQSIRREKAMGRSAWLAICPQMILAQTSEKLCFLFDASTYFAIFLIWPRNNLILSTVGQFLSIDRSSPHTKGLDLCCRDEVVLVLMIPRQLSSSFLSICLHSLDMSKGFGFKRLAST